MRSADFLLITATLLATMAIAPLAILAAPIDPDRPVVAIVSPWADVSQSLEAAGLTEIAPLRAPLGVLVNAQEAKDARTRRAQGIWLLLDGTIIASICGETDV